VKIDGIDKETGEIIKPYDTKEHKEIMKVIARQVAYVRANIKDDDQEKIAGLSGDGLVEVLMTLTGYYEELGKWLADEKLHMADMRTALDIKFAQEYIKQKQLKSETNETARMKAKIYCAEDQIEVDENKHAVDVIEAWKKAIGRYHDAVRSQLSYEKSLSQMTR
jgi:hypothetical protein